jgi:hypothetical protein
LGRFFAQQHNTTKSEEMGDRRRENETPNAEVLKN